MNRNSIMMRKMLISLTNGLVKVSRKLLSLTFLLLMKTYMVLFLCMTTIPCLLLELIFGEDDILRQYQTIAKNFKEQKITD